MPRLFIYEMGACLGARVYFRDIVLSFALQRKKKTLDATRCRHDRYIVVFYIIRLLIVFRREVHVLRFNLSFVLKNTNYRQ